ncbi:MAG: protein translocase subunit SecD [Clostridia bacterium]|nr:protein translocase subunit SecD [Clostridia bacterium]
MKRVAKPVFFIVAILIVALAVTSVFGIKTQYGDIVTTRIKGVSDIRWGIDIKGGVEATFQPADGVDATPEQLESAKSVIETRMVANNITDYELYADDSANKIIVRFPWKEETTNFDPYEAIEEISATATLTFRPGNSYESIDYTDDGTPVMKTPTGETAQTVLVDGSNVKNAQAGVINDNGKTQYVVSLEFDDEGAELFRQATTDYLNGTISIWMDDTMISYPTVNSVITDGSAQISGNFTAEEATALATKINAGALPFSLETVNAGSISPTLGANSLRAMALAAVIAFAIITVFMIIVFRVPGFVAVIALLGQLAITIVAVSGYFPVFNSFTMTLPGIAGMILSIGMGVDANIITAERIKEELKNGKSLDSAINAGTKNSLSAIIDGNMTVIIVAVILILVFGPFNMLSFIFGLSTTGSIYAFGYTLLVGVISNFIMGIAAARLMLKSISGFKFLRNTRLYGGAKK